MRSILGSFTLLVFIHWTLVSSQSCPSVKRDLVILLDSSGSLTKEEFHEATEFLASFIDDLEVSAEAYQIAVVRFSDNTRREAKLGQFNERKEDLMSKVVKIYHNGGGTNTSKALNYALTKILTKGNRKDASDQILTLTDGESDDMKATARMIEVAHRKQVEMISIGVGAGVNDIELRNLASRSELMFKVKSYAELSNIKSQLVASSCGLTMTVPTTTSTTTTTTTTPTTTTTSPTTTTTATSTITPPTTTTATNPTTTSTTWETTTSLATDTPTLNSTSTTNMSLPYSNSTNDEASRDANYYNHEVINHGLREKRNMVESASAHWQKVMGTSVAVFALTAIISGMIAIIVKNRRRKRKKHTLDTL
ncbi:G8 domain-containing protein DDB_G0286311-like [Haliotis rubra]|uniref:G8 domain-containing protein DDB_G0286311-like n=1 Tax=Haliotis rubra TaxID=36100 RepID=UPI001EE5A6C3|nr:G8 domain-containing protein DDB_G0286311-like [Haliotis rubra]